MEPAKPSRTALRVALRRAAHQLLDAPLVFADPLAVPILGSTYAEELRRTPTRLDRPFSHALRAFLVARSRFAEDNLNRAVAAGVTQYVLLGAGLDTFGYRNPYPELLVFEVDHPATQQWKHELLQQSSILVPPNVVYAPVDFEHQSLAAQLAIAGLDTAKATFFAWLGVVPYLTLEAFRATVKFVADQPAGTGLTFDYGLPRSALPFVEQLMYDSLAARVAMAGEPFQLHFTPQQIVTELDGFSAVEDLGAAEINARYFPGRDDQLAMRGSGGRLLCAWRRPEPIRT